MILLWDNNKERKQRFSSSTGTVTDHGGVTTSANLTSLQNVAVATGEQSVQGLVRFYASDVFIFR